VPPSAAILGLLVILEGQMRLTAIAFYKDHDVRPTPSVSRTQHAAAGGPPAMWRLHMKDPYLRESARQIVGEAADWLSFPQCQLLLSDFADRRGQHLAGKLTELGVTAAGYLSLIVFEDGATQAACSRHGILAFTSVGSRLIYLCGRDFVRAAQRAPEEMRAVIIHEMLHSLGLGENPPSSKEITYQVKQRCWR
jgi:hypothetical protein